MKRARTRLHRQIYVGDRVLTLSDPAVTPIDPAATPIDPTVMPSDRIVTPNDHIVAPTSSDPAATPSDPTVMPSDHILTPTNPIVTPTDHIVTPSDPAVTPTNPTVIVTPSDCERVHVEWLRFYDALHDRRIFARLASLRAAQICTPNSESATVLKVVLPTKPLYARPCRFGMKFISFEKIFSFRFLVDFYANCFYGILFRSFFENFFVMRKKFSGVFLFFFDLKENLFKLKLENFF